MAARIQLRAVSVRQPNSRPGMAHTDPEQKFVALQSGRLTSALIRGDRYAAHSRHGDRRPAERELGVRSEYLSA